VTRRSAGVLAATSVALVVLTSGCTEHGAATKPVATSAASSSTPEGGIATPYGGYPDSIVVLGHSGSTGESSDPAQPGVAIPANSWATGTNPAVHSLYQRILAVHPQIRGHNLALSRGGATVADLVDQAVAAVARQPRNPLVVVQIMDNDIVCPAAQSDFDTFQATFESALQVVDEGLPTSRLFVVSQYGSPTTGWRMLSRAQRVSFGGTGPCDFLDPRGDLVPPALDRLEDAIHGYEAALKAGCLKLARCRSDQEAFGTAPDRAEFVAPDLNHFSVKGHAQAAAVAWAAMKKAGLVPAPG
jgi:hypothetical protein